MDGSHNMTSVMYIYPITAKTEGDAHEQLISL